MLSGCAAVTSKTIAAPIERLKMVIQNQDELVKKGILPRRFRGIGECTTWILKNEGPMAFWKSNFTNCVRYFPTQALNFSLLGKIKAAPAFKVDRKNDSMPVQLLKNCAGGGVAGSISLLFVYSLDYARTRLANDLKASKGGGDREFTGLVDVYKKTFAAEGIAGLYAGFVISCVGIFIYRGLYFGLFNTVMPMVPTDSVSAFTRFAVAYVVTVAAGLASYPIDTIRRRMMMVAGGAAEHKYTSSLHCATYIAKHDGIPAFFKGAGANILRGVAGAGVLALFDTFVQMYVTQVYGAGFTAKISGGGG